MRTHALILLAVTAAAPCQSFFPAPLEPFENPGTPEKELLGMTLFWEEQLSSTDTVACGTCHAFRRAGAEGRTLPAINPGADGIFGTADDVRGSRGVPARDASGHAVPSPYGFGPQVTGRKAPSVINAAYKTKLFYDGRAGNGSCALGASGPVALENLVMGPLLNPVEMALPGRGWSDIIAKVTWSQPLRLATNVPVRLAQFVDGRTYPELFTAAYGTPGVTAARIVFAIATYVRTLVSDQTKFDRALASIETLTPQEQHGRTLFETPQNGAAACVQCHSDVSPQSHTFGPAPFTFVCGLYTPTANLHNTGLRPIAEDPGVGAITQLAADQGRFNTPMLRNVALQGSYGHNGQYATLDEMVAFYDRGGDFHTNQAPEIRPRNMTAQDRADLVAFLRTLTDPRVVSGLPPFDSPTLSGGVEYRPTIVGIGTAGTDGRVPQMLAQDPVLLGKSMVMLGVHQARANSFAMLVWDQGVQPVGIPVIGPLLFLSLAQPAVVSVGATRAAFDGSGYQSAVFAVPRNPQLVGAQFGAQWIIVDPAGPNGLTASPAVAVTVQ